MIYTNHAACAASPLSPFIGFLLNIRDNHRKARLLVSCKTLYLSIQLVGHAFLTCPVYWVYLEGVLPATVEALFRISAQSPVAK
jgi:hypothetical protein